MLAQAVQFVSSISESVKTVSFGTHKLKLLNSFALMVTCSIGASLYSPAQAASFAGFGCKDNPTCQSYLEFINTTASAGVGYSNDAWNLPSTRVSSPLLFDPGIPDGPRHTLNVLWNQTYSDTAGTPLVNHSGNASASLETVLKLGQLKALASASANVNITELLPGYGSYVGGSRSNSSAQTYLGWGDTITVTSSTHAQGELVPFEVRLYLDRTIQVSSTGYAQAYVGADLSLSGFFQASIFDTNFYPSALSMVTKTVYLPVGQTTSIEGRLQIGVYADVSTTWPERPLATAFSIANASHTANYYLTPLVSGVNYTSASANNYFYSGNTTSVPEPSFSLALFGFGLLIWRSAKWRESESKMRM